jgi:hypothetical protein
MYEEWKVKTGAAVVESDNVTKSVAHAFKKAGWIQEIRANFIELDLIPDTGQRIAVVWRPT